MAQRAKASVRETEKLLRECERQLPGCVTGGGSKHFKVKTPRGGLVILSSSRSGGRGAANAQAQLRRGGFEL